jgi:hypothetical protein
VCVCGVSPLDGSPVEGVQSTAQDAPFTQQTTLELFRDQHFSLFETEPLVLSVGVLGLVSGVVVAESPEHRSTLSASKLAKDSGISCAMQ